MSIEFNCPICQKLLRTSDDKVGIQAKCPDCKTSITVPDPSADENFDYEPAEEPRPPIVSVAATKTCPMCAEDINTTAVKCRYCGAFLDEDDAHHSTESQFCLIDAGDVISTSWEIYKQQLGPCVIGLLIILGASLVIAVVAWVGVLIAFAIASAIGPVGGGILILVTIALFFFGVLALSSYLAAGQHIFFMKIARGQNANYSDLFSGTPYIWRMMGNMILFSIIVFLGEILCVVPGILLALMLWPYQFILVDQKFRGLPPLWQAKEITTGNWGSCFILGLAAFGIHLVGSLALGIGIIFTGPFIILMSAVAYCKMTGQKTARV